MCVCLTDMEADQVGHQDQFNAQAGDQQSPSFQLLQK